MTHGIMPDDPRLLEEESKLAQEADPPDQVCEPPERRAGEPRRVAWTDGACRFNQDARVRRAGWGVFWGRDDPENIGKPLAGLQQTNQRAELRAATRAVNRGAEEVRTDSQWVVDGHARLCRGERAAARGGSDT